MNDSTRPSLLHSTPLPMLLLAATMSVAILAAGVLTIDAATADREVYTCSAIGALTTSRHLPDASPSRCGAREASRHG